MWLPEHSIEKLGLKQRIIIISFLPNASSRAFHRKTRIETKWFELPSWHVQTLPEHSIEKLGLKHGRRNRRSDYYNLPEHSIEKLGLKHVLTYFYGMNYKHFQSIPSKN